LEGFEEAVDYKWGWGEQQWRLRGERAWCWMDGMTARGKES